MQSRCLLVVSISVLYLVGTLSTVWHVAGQNLKLVHPCFQVQLHSNHWGSHRSKEENRSRAQNRGSWSVTESRFRKLENYKYCPYLKVLAVCLLNSPQPLNWQEFQQWRYLFHKGRLQLEYMIFFFFLQRHIRSQFELLKYYPENVITWDDELCDKCIHLQLNDKSVEKKTFQKVCGKRCACVTVVSFDVCVLFHSTCK